MDVVILIRSASRILVKFCRTNFCTVFATPLYKRSVAGISSENVPCLTLTRTLSGPF